MASAKIKKGDQVIVLTGRDKGKKGEVFQVMPKESRALVRGVNVVRRHQRQTARTGRRDHLQGGADPSVEPGAGGSQGRQADARRLQAAGRRPQGAHRQALRRDDSGEELAMAEDEKPQRPPKPDKAAARGRQAGQGAEARQGRPTRPPRARGDKAAKGPKGAPKDGKGAPRDARRAQGREGRAGAASQGLQAAHEDALREGGARGDDQAVRLQEPHADPPHREDRAQHGRGRGRQRPQEGRLRRQGPGHDRRPARR